MKFLCRNCKAKYQIADEKVAGRTLRMTCQQCGEQIAVRGPGARASVASRPLSQSLSSPSVAPASSALGVDFQRQVSAHTQDAATNRAQDEWHVAINDVPVGPMRRDELARKIAAGAVHRESLAWREGMDDWLPVKHIPELFSLIEPAQPIGPPPTSSMPAPPVQPAARAPMAPIGGRQMLSLEEYAQPQELMAAAMMEPAVTVSQVNEPASAGKPLGWAQMFALVSGGALIMMVGAVMGVKMLSPPSPARDGGAAGAAAPASSPAAAAQRAAAPAHDEDGNVIELDMQAIDGESSGGTARRGAGASAGGADKKASAAVNGKQLTDEQKAMLARMGGSLEQGPNLRAPGEAARSGSAAGGGGQLTAAQLSQVVLRGRKNLQRCYETALRGANSDETVRLDVDVEVSPSGNVTSARTTGKGLPGMDECITRTVRMWRFPMSGDGAQTRFPVVFQPGG